MAYPYYQNNQYYMQNMQDLQNMKERIDSQMKQMQQFNQNQMQQPQIPQVNQTFQLAPNPTNNELESKYANNIDEVRNTFVMKTGVFVNKDFTSLWIKDVTGNIRTFRTEEVIEKDPKEIEIENLKAELQRVKYELYEQSNTTNELQETKEQVKKKSNKKD